MSVKLAFNNGTEIGFAHACLKLAEHYDLDENSVYVDLMQKLAEDPSSGPGLGTAAAIAGGAGATGVGGAALMANRTLPILGAAEQAVASGTENLAKQDAYRQKLDADIKKINKIVGNVRGDNSQQLRQLAREHGVRLTPQQLRVQTEATNSAIANTLKKELQPGITNALHNAELERQAVANQLQGATANQAAVKGSMGGRAATLARRLGITDPKVLKRLGVAGVGLGALGLGVGAYNALSGE